MKVFLKKKNGFTLVEMLISLGIIGAIVSVILFNQNTFSNNLDVANLAYRVALAVREAQIYGISVRASGGNYDQAYGVHFHIGNSQDDPSRKNLIVFADTQPDPDGNLMYSDGPNTDECPQTPTSECVERITMNRGNRISQICFEEPDSDIACIGEAGQGYAEARSVDVLFKRPNPDAIFSYYNNGGGGAAINVPMNALLVCVESVDGKKKEIAVYATGQISVRDDCANSFTAQSQDPEIPQGGNEKPLDPGSGGITPGGERR